MPSRKHSDLARWDTEALIEGLGELNATARTGALAVFAHHLTVEIRILLSEASLDRSIIDRVRAINEFEHQLTSRLHPDEPRSSERDKSMLRDIVMDAVRCGLTPAVKRGLVVAARNAFANAAQPVAAH